MFGYLLYLLYGTLACSTDAYRIVRSHMFLQVFDISFT